MTAISRDYRDGSDRTAIMESIVIITSTVAMMRVFTIIAVNACNCGYHHTGEHCQD